MHVFLGPGGHDTYLVNSCIHLFQLLNAGSLQSGTWSSHLFSPSDFNLWSIWLYQSSDHGPLSLACTRPFPCSIYVFTPVHHRLPISFPFGLMGNHSNILNVYPFVCMCSYKIQSHLVCIYFNLCKWCCIICGMLFCTFFYSTQVRFIWPVTYCCIAFHILPAHSPRGRHHHCDHHCCPEHPCLCLPLTFWAAHPGTELISQGACV